MGNILVREDFRCLWLDFDAGMSIDPSDNTATEEWMKIPHGGLTVCFWAFLMQRELNASAFTGNTRLRVFRSRYGRLSAQANTLAPSLGCRVSMSFGILCDAIFAS